VEERVEGGEEHGIRGEVAFQEGARLLVGEPGREEPAVDQLAAHGGVDGEDGLARGVEQDGVGNLALQAGQRDEVPAKHRERRGLQAVHAAAGSRHEPAGEGQQRTGPSCRHAGPAQDGGQRGPWERREPAGREQAARAQRGDGAPGRARPGAAVIGARGGTRVGVANNEARSDFVAGAPRWPRRGSEPAEQGDVKAEQPGLDRIGRRPRDQAPPRARRRD
jgi:hypothetical protein